MENQKEDPTTMQIEETKTKIQSNSTSTLSKKQPLISGEEFTNDFSFKQLQQDKDLKLMETGHLLADIAKVSEKQMDTQYDYIGDLTQGDEYYNNTVANEKDLKNVNRYSDILPYKSSLVQLKNNQYINANYVNSVFGADKKFIATQGPLKSTIETFWAMVSEENVNNIFMLCRTEEKGQKKCEEYWPKTAFKSDKLNFNVEFVNEEPVKQEFQNLIKRTFHLQNAQEKTRTVNQYYYSGWPDHGVPTTESEIQFKEMVKISRDLFYKTQNEQILYHCSAGVGRTGTLITSTNIHLILDHYYNTKKYEGEYLSIFSLVRRLREQRVSMVQTVEQYQFLYQLSNSLISELGLQNFTKKSEL